MSWLTSLACALMAIYLCQLSLKTLLAWMYVRRIRRRSPDVREEGQSLSALEAGRVTILQPILSGDPTLARTLSANLHGLPVQVRFIWLVDSDDVQGIQVCHEIANHHRNVEVLHCPPSPEGVNPKSFKLEIGLEKVASDLCFVLDDDTIVESSAIAAAVQSLGCQDLYTGLPVYRAAAEFWSHRVVDFVNGNAALTYVPLLNFFPPLSINGMFYAFHTEKLRKLGGFTSIFSELCDDYAFKRLASRANWKIEQGITKQSVGTSVDGIVAYFRLLHRWTLFAQLLVRDQTFRLQFLLVGFLGLPALLLLVIFTTSVWSWNTLWYLVLFLVIRHALLRTSQKIVFQQFTPMTFGGSILTELLQPFHMVSALCYPVIRWRTRRIRVCKNQSNQFSFTDRQVP